MDDAKPNELVEKLLNEDPGDEKLDPVYVQRRDAARAEADADDDGADDEDDPDNEIDFSSESEFADKLAELIEENIPGVSVSSFRDVGMLTRNEGLVVRTPNGGFQITIVEDRRRY